MAWLVTRTAARVRLELGSGVDHAEETQDLYRIGSDHHSSILFLHHLSASFSSPSGDCRLKKAISTSTNSRLVPDIPSLPPSAQRLLSSSPFLSFPFLPHCFWRLWLASLRSHHFHLLPFRVVTSDPPSLDLRSTSRPISLCSIRYYAIIQLVVNANAIAMHDGRVYMHVA